MLTEVVELFPGRFVHVGMDEIPKDAWTTDPEEEDESVVETSKKLKRAAKKRVFTFGMFCCGFIFKKKEKFFVTF